MNAIAKKLTSHFAGPNGVWIVERGKETEAKMFQEAIAEITELEDLLSDAQTSIADEFREKHNEVDAMIKEWQTKLTELNGSIKNIRNAAKGLVTQIDKAQGDLG